MRGEVVFRADPLKAILLLFGCTVFTLLALAFSERFFAVFFGMGIPASLLMLSDKNYYLKLTPRGIEVRALLRTSFIRWRDIKAFRIGAIRGTKVIAISYQESYAEQRLGRGMMSLFAGIEDYIPNTYEMAAEEMLDTLCQWHDRHSGPVPTISMACRHD